MKIGISQNTWPVYDNTSNFVRTKVQNVGFWSANADVAYVMDHFTQQYHTRIEHIDLPVKETPGYDDWSWAVRPVRGQTTGYSNHGSATARDINATRHPRGVRNTYTTAKRKELKNLVDEYEGVLRHGEFYNSTVDGMHVEINDGITPARVKALADKLRAKDAEKEDDVSFQDEHKLTAPDVAAYGNPNLKAGISKKSYDELVRFPPATERLRRENAALHKAHATQMATLTAAVQALAANSPAAVKAAFDTGIKNLKAQFDDLDLKLTIDDGE